MRIKRAVNAVKKRRKILRSAKGYWGAKSKHFKMAKQAVLKSGNYAFAGRKMKKRDFRRLWIARISAAAKANGIYISNAKTVLTVSGGTFNRYFIGGIHV